jgi:NifU-like protein involved in Fe-S cluster formation
VNVHGYPDAVWARFHAPRFAGPLPGATASAQAGTPAGKAVLRLELRCANSRIEAARFLAYGCPVTLAVGDWLAERLQGAETGRLSTISAADIRAALEIPDARAHCSLMGEDVLRALSKRLNPQQ